MSANLVLYEEFLAILKDTFATEAKNMSMSVWVERNTTLKRKPFNYKGYEFQRQILDDMHPSMDVKKCSQIGLSEISLRKSLAFARRNPNTTVIFTLPNEEMYGRTSLTRLRPILDADKVFRPIGTAKPIKNVHTIQVGRSFVIMAAAIESAATSTPADMVLNDEVDLSDQAMLTLFRSRMQNSNFKINQRFSTPTHIKFGIDENYTGTDSHVWMRRCQACNKHQVVDFSLQHIAIPGFSGDLERLADIEEHHLAGLDWNDAYVKCVKCAAPLDMTDPSLCEWVPQFPENKNRRGYHVTPFCTSRLTPGYILGELFEYKRKANVTLRRFYNTVLGEAFTDASQRLSYEEIVRCFEGTGVKGPQSRDVPISIGIDVGASCHIVLGIPGLAFGFTIVPAHDLLKTLKMLDERYRIATGCIDRHPYEPTANEVFQWSKGRILPVEYRGQAEVALIRDKFKTITHGQVNRTACLDAIVQEIRNSSIKFAEYGGHKETILTQLQDMVRKDDEPEQEAVWEKLKGNDHFFHALALMRIAPRFRSLAQFESDEEQRVESDSMVIPMAPIAGLTHQPKMGFGIRPGVHRVLG